MKKIIFTLLSSTSMLVFGQSEGTAVYEMSIEGLPPEQASMMGDMMMKIVWKGDKSYYEQSSMMFETKSVTDENGTLMLMDQMGNKYYMKYKPEELSKESDKGSAPEYKIEQTNETKKIAGYDCKKAIVTTKTRDGKEFKIDIWYTDKIPNYYAKQKNTTRRNQDMSYLKSINGMPMEYTIPQGQMTIKVTAKEVNFNPVSDDVFKLSTDGYTEIKPDDLKKMRGGQ
jgi:hypothetical protein